MRVRGYQPCWQRYKHRPIDPVQRSMTRMGMSVPDRDGKSTDISLANWNMIATIVSSQTSSRSLHRGSQFGEQASERNVPGPGYHFEQKPATTTLTNPFANVSDPEVVIIMLSSREQPHWEADQIEAQSFRMPRRGILRSMIGDSP